MNFFRNYLLIILLLLAFVSSSFASDFYWVGNSGNWNDASHWSTISGGKGEALVPGKFDNVIFDNQSFSSANSSIQIDGNVQIKNLTISSKINFILSSDINSEIEIYGSVNISSIFNNKIKSKIRLKSNESETVGFGWFLWYSDIYFEGTGTYKLISPIQNHNNSINHISGTLDLNGFDVLCGSFISNSTNKKVLKSDKSTILAYNKWEVSESKNNFDFSKTTIFSGESPVPVFKKKPNYEIVYLNTNSSTFKTVSNGVVSTDTVSCGNNCDGVLTVVANTTCPTATVDWLPGSGTNDYIGECITCPIPGPTVRDTISGLCPGVYTAVIRNNCDASVIAPQGRVEGHPSIVPIFEDIVGTKCKDTCDGSINVVVTGASFAVFDYQWYPMPPFTLADNTPTVTGLCAGNYSLEVKDGFGCIDTFDYVITEPDYVYPNVTITNINCFNDCSGSATANPYGGNGGYTYQWSANALPNVLTNAGISNLCVGTYTVDVLDSKGCPGDTSVTIQSPDSLTITSSQINVSCGGYCDASASATVVSGGVGPFTHNWSTGFSETLNAGQTSTISSLCAGTYTDSISDGNGCDTVITFVITEPDTLLTNTSIADVKCFGACDGTAATYPYNGTPPYNYLWSPGGAITDSISSLCPGQYIVRVRDSKGCEIRDTVTINEPTLLVANPSTIQNMSCPGICDGVATSNPIGGTSPYTYSWNNGDITQTTTTGLCDGYVVVTVTDSNLCTATDSVLIVEPQPMVLTMNSSDVKCNTACDGTGSVTVTGGTPNYTYIWVPAPPFGQGTSSISGLCPNTYTVTVTDSGGCIASNSITIDEPNALSINISTIDLRCNQVCQGSATATPQGGVSPYTVSWDGGPFVPVFGPNTSTFNLCAGAHTVSIRDANNCLTPLNFNINEPTALTTVSSTTDLSCFGICNGTATTNPSGGTSPYTYSWNTLPIPRTTQSINSLCAGTYVVTITDDSICTTTDTVVVAEPTQIDANVQFTDITCNNQNNGTATSLPFGGTPGYTIVWNTVPAGAPIPGNPIFGLSAGQYFVTVTDSKGCVDRDTISITNPLLIDVNATAISSSCQTNCDGQATANPTGGVGGYSYLWSSGDFTQTTTATLCPGNYTVTVTDSNGCSITDQVTISPSIVINIITDTVGISCNGACDGEATAFPNGGVAPYSYSWNTVPPQNTQIATGLCPGNYTVIVTDQTGCIATQSVTMPVDPNVLVPNGSSTNVTCYGLNDGTITSSPSGGVPPYTLTYSVSPQTGLAPGTYWVTVTDANSCSQTDTLIITQPDSIESNPTIVNVNCNGNSTGSISLNPTGGVPGYTYLWNGGLGSNSSISGLNDGTYIVAITDSNGCSVLDTFNISEPQIFASNPYNVHETCNGACDGIAGIILSGGTPPYSTSWSTVPPQSTDTITGLCPGNYSVISIDSNGCSTNQTITINGNQALSANVTGSSIQCNGNCTGTATATPSGGSGGYTYIWTAVGGSPISNPTGSSISNLCPDTYQVTITDTSGCTINGSYTVSDVAVLQVTLDSTNITCNSLNDGSATATPIGGVSPYSYSWTGGNLPIPTTTSSISNLVPGIYSITVTDSNGCFFNGNVNIVEPALISTNEVIINANCGATDGSITVNPTGGTPGYSHSWSTGSISNSISNLSAGFYTDTISDAAGCSQTFTFAVSNPTGPTGVVVTVNDATCFGSCDGSANVIPIGGTPAYSYVWNIPGETDSTISGLCAGTYNLTVTDAANCVLNTFVVIGQTDSITLNVNNSTVSCNGSCDAVANVVPSGGTAPYTYLWADGQTTSSVSGLCFGASSVTVTDANGCQKVENFTISSPNILSVTTNNTDVACNSDTSGTATVIPVGGTSPYTYQWDDPASQNTATATGLAAGTYNVTVTDANGCFTNASVTINENSLIAANDTVIDANCGNNDGSITLAPSGGTSPYSYIWTSMPGVTVPNVTGLAAGSYTVEITDSNGCMQSFLIPVNNTNGPTINVSTSDASCGGNCDGSATASVVSGTPNYSYLWTGGGITGQTTSSVSGLCADSYTIQITDGNGCSTVQSVTIGENSLITANVSTIDVSCSGGSDGSAIVVPSGGVPPYSYSWSGPCVAPNNNAVTNLCAGNYTVTITDSKGCSSPISVVINESNVLSVSAIANNNTCFGQNDGSATASASGGTAPYSYLWSNGLTTPTVSGLSSGNYSVTVTDIIGCSTTTNVTIFSGNAIAATFNSTNAACGSCDGTATINVDPGSGPYSYFWLPTGQTGQTANNLCPGSYNVEVTNMFGCEQTFTVLISNPNGPSLSSDSDSTQCFGSCDGSAWTEVLSGNPNYIYQWDDNLLQASDTATALCAGFYSVVVQDSVGCVTVDTVTVYEPTEIQANLTKTPISCFGVCDATATVNPTGGVGIYTVVWSNGDTGLTASNLCSGNHSVTITDGNSCPLVYNFTINSPTVLSLSLSSTSPTCNADCDGTALVTASGGTAPYIYSWNSTPVQTNSLATSLCDGIYTVTVTDNRGCANSDSIAVVSPTILSTTSTVIDASCNGQNTGSITTNPTGGIPPYTYIWSTTPIQTGQTATSLAAGIYNVIVVDANGCTAYDTLNVNEPSALLDSSTVIGPNCGVCNGSATANPSGGVGPYAYLWGNGDTTQTTSTGLCAGTISLQITDIGTGCSSQFTVIVNSVNGPNLILSKTDETCPGLCNGSILVSASGGNAPFSYSWSPTGGTDSLAIGLCSNFYTVTVTDSMNCVSTDTISINSNGLNLSISNIIPESCVNSCDGSATVVVSNGVLPFTYLWNPIGGNNSTAINLCSGNYTVTVTDSLNCSDSISTVITSPTTFDATINMLSQISCYSSCDASLSVSPIGGTPPFTYLWSNGQTSSNISNLCVGTYWVEVFDAGNCSVFDTITISEPSQIVANEVLINPACNVCDGQIQLNPSGGSGPYQYLWSSPLSPQNTSTVINLCAGVYEVEITDNTNCSTTFIFALSNTNAPDPNVTVTNPSCFNTCDGSLVSSPIGGVSPYTYVWSPNATPNSLFGNAITNLCPDVFTLNVTDSVGCVGVAIDTIIATPQLFANITSSNITCFGFNDGWASVTPTGGTTPYNIAVWNPGGTSDSISSLTPGTYIVSITDNNGCTVQDSTIITEPTAISASSTVTNASCSSVCNGQIAVTASGGVGGYSYSWSPSGQITSVATNLCFGSHQISITDANGCLLIQNINVGSSDTIVAFAGNDTSICEDNSILLQGITTGNATGVEWFALPSMNSIGVADTITVQSAVPGTFCYVFAAYGACNDYDTVCVTFNAKPTVNAGIDITIIEGTSGQLTATGGGSYVWTPSLGLSDTTIANPIATPEETTTYTVTVTSSDGCSASDQVTVIVIPTIQFPDGITPNGDGKNDTWVIDYIDQYPNHVVEIYNRWGELLYRSTAYKNDWDGKYNGENLPIGTYYYVIELNDGKTKPFTGPITVLR